MIRSACPVNDSFRSAPLLPFQAPPQGRAFFVALLVVPFLAATLSSAFGQAKPDGEITAADAIKLGQEFGIEVGEVDEEIQKELKLTKPEGVVVFEVIGGTPADLAGIKVRAVIKEIDKMEVRNLKDFGRALKKAMVAGNFTVGTYEPADPEVQGVGGLVNFHFVRIVKD
jgi:S1-C subfamily serine protease